MGLDVDIRQPRPGEWPVSRDSLELDALVLAHGEELNRTHGELIDLADQLYNDPFTEVWVAVSPRDGVVGFVALHLGRKRSDRHTASLRILVDEGARGSNVGTRLIETALAWADANDVARITATPYTARRFHIERGWGYTPESARKVRFFTRHGFAHEGVMRAAARQGDQFVDIELLARVKRGS